MANSDKQCMLNDIGIVDFTLVDLMLFLDTHPDSCEAMEYFNHYAKIKNKMVKDFSMMYYPLTKEHAESSMEWRWGSAPLPWEGDC